MDHKMIKSAAEEIRIPEEMKLRIVRNCRREVLNDMEESTMKKYKSASARRRPVIVCAALILCLALCVTAFAGTEALQG